MKKIAVIGLGGISVVHIASILTKKLGNIEAICDIDQSKIATARERIPYETKEYTDYKTMLKEVRPDVVHICTPHFLHKQMASDAVISGADVYLEKPAAINYAEALELLEIQKASGKRICVSFQNRVIPTNFEAKRIISSGEYGKVLGIRGFMTWRRDGEYYTKSPWRGRWKTEGGGVLMNQSIHTLDLMYYFGGEIEKTKGSASLRKNADIIEVEDTAEATLFYKNGSMGIFYATNCNAIDAGVQIDIYLERAKLSLHDNGLFMDTREGYKLVTDNSVGKSYGKVVWGNGHAIMMENFYSSIDGDEKYYCTLEDAIKVLNVIDDIYRTSPEKLNPNI